MFCDNRIARAHMDKKVSVTFQIVADHAPLDFEVLMSVTAQRGSETTTELYWFEPEEFETFMTEANEFHKRITGGNE